MANNLKHLDANQVLRSVYDVDNNRLRTDASLSASIGTIEVVIDHVNDSIKIGDGTNTVDVTTNNELKVSDAEALAELQDISAQLGGIATPTILNISIPTANIEQSTTFPASTKKIFFQLEGNAKLQYSFTAAQSGTNYITIPSGGAFEIEGLKLSSTLTLYFQASRNNQILQVLYWV